MSKTYLEFTSQLYLCRKSIIPVKQTNNSVSWPSKTCSLSPRKCWTISSVTFCHFSWLSCVYTTFLVMKHKQHRSEMLCREVTFPLKGIHTCSKLQRHIYLLKVTVSWNRCRKKWQWIDSAYTGETKRHPAPNSPSLTTAIQWLHTKKVWKLSSSKGAVNPGFNEIFRRVCWLFLSRCIYESLSFSQRLLSCSLLFLPSSSWDFGKVTELSMLWHNQPFEAFAFHLNFIFRISHSLSKHTYPYFDMKEKTMKKSWRVWQTLGHK